MWGVFGEKIKPVGQFLLFFFHVLLCLGASSDRFWSNRHQDLENLELENEEADGIAGAGAGKKKHGMYHLVMTNIAMENDP